MINVHYVHDGCSKNEYEEKQILVVRNDSSD